MGRYTINPVFLNKILSMAKTGIGWSHYKNTSFENNLGELETGIGYNLNYTKNI